MIHELPSYEQIPALAQQHGWDAETAGLMVRGTEAFRWLSADLADSMTAKQVADYQAALAVWETYRPATDRIDWPWKPLQGALGPMLPKDLIVVPAKTGSGKTTFVLNLWDALIEAGIPALMLPLETDPQEFRTKWAALRADLNPTAVMQGNWNALPPGSRTRWNEEMARLTTRSLAPLAHIEPTEYVSAPVLVDLVTRYVGDYGIRIVIVDHVHRMEHGQGRNQFAEFSQTIVTAKNLAKSHQIVNLLTAQLNRATRDPLQRLMLPPQLEDIRGGGTIEEEANTVLFTHYLPKPGLNKADRADFKNGILGWTDLVAENTMGVTVGKHRIDGSARHKTLRLAHRFGRLYDGDDEWDRAARRTIERHEQEEMGDAAEGADVDLWKSHEHGA